jgi:hypothetical protein
VFDLLATTEEPLVDWALAGHAVRPGPWPAQAEPTADLIEAALADGRLGDAAALGRHLVVEAQEIHDLYTDWAAALPRMLAREGVVLEVAQESDPAADWERFLARVERFAAAPERGALNDAIEAWRAAHDHHRDLVAAWLDLAVTHLGEGRLGDVWRELQADGIAAYTRYDPRVTPWSESFPFVVQTAIEGMHGHLGGPRGRGEVRVTEHDDRVELRFEPCGSGGRVRAAERFGVTADRHDFAWNEVGVCHYCVHCCVLMQLEPIDRLGFPVRVIDPPLRPGEGCTWTVYRDPGAVPEAAYRRVGREKP